MPFFVKGIRPFLFILLCLAPTFLFAAAANPGKLNIPILCYHNFNPTTPGWMNMTPERFESQIKWLRDNGYTIIPLKDAVAYLQGKRDSLPPKPVVITDDDGWISVYHYLYPIVQKYKFPVTLFIYPETISSGKNALTWQDLKELQQTGYFDIQAHTYSHPNFKVMKKHLSPEAYDKFVVNELVKSKKILEEKTGKEITLLAWPFGIYNNFLEEQAAKAGYTMAFTIDFRKANRSFEPMGQPRFMILQDLSMKTFTGLMKETSAS